MKNFSQSDVIRFNIFSVLFLIFLVVGCDQDIIPVNEENNDFFSLLLR